MLNLKAGVRGTHTHVLYAESEGETEQVGNDRGTQYRHGIYYHSPEQQAVAEASLQALVADDTPSIATEIKEAGKFWDAEEYHMQYLQKGGQDARKAATETIRCYG